MRIILLMAFCLASAGSPGRAAGRTLPAPHTKAGVTCFDCHQTEKPTGPADPSACMNCHGDAPAMAAQTRSLPMNPHNPPKPPHPGPFACIDCHHQHRPPVVKCKECH